MEKVIIRLLEISRQLDEANLGEFDFGKLRDALLAFEEKAPEIARLEKDCRVLSNHILLRVVGRLRALNISEGSRQGGYPEERLIKSGRLTAERLVELDRELSGEVNRIFSARPGFRRVTSPESSGRNNQEYKIGGQNSPRVRE